MREIDLTKSMYQTGSGDPMMLTYLKRDALRNSFPVVDILSRETLPCFYFFIKSDQKSWQGKFFSSLAALQTNSELGSDQTFAAATAVQNEDDLLHLVDIKPWCSVI